MGLAGTPGADTSTGLLSPGLLSPGTGGFLFPGVVGMLRSRGLRALPWVLSGASAPKGWGLPLCTPQGSSDLGPVVVQGRCPLGPGALLAPGLVPVWAEGATGLLSEA